MPKRKSIKKKPDDINVLAKSIVDQTTGEELFDQEIIKKALAEGKDPLAVLLGHRGGLKGGKARAAKLSSKKRKEIAKKAAKARWNKEQ
jgi:hypothetical protein